MKEGHKDNFFSGRSAQDISSTLYDSCFSLCILLLVPFLCSCSKTKPLLQDYIEFHNEELPVESPEPLTSDTLYISITENSNIHDTPAGHIEWLDVFIYDCGIVETLSKHLRLSLSSPASNVKFVVESDSHLSKSVYAAANVPGTFCDSLLTRPESLCSILVALENDSPDRPIMTGWSRVEAVSSVATVIINPLLSRILVEELENNYGNDTVVERPSLIIENTMSHSPLYPDVCISSFIDTHPPIVTSLGPDVGIRPSSPWTSIYFYPASTAPVIHFEYSIKAGNYNIPISAPTITRNSTFDIPLLSAP